MSEYQYYEFQAIDQPLSNEAQQEMERLSSRVQLTATSASFVYNYGDFRGDPKQVLAEYFDAMLYITNWGTRQLMFRFPASALHREDLEPYALANSLSISQRNNYLILDIESHDESGENWGWAEGEGWLSKLVQLRENIMQNDLRALYLAWLAAARYEYELLEEDEDLNEPRVPPGLRTLSPTLKHFIAFFELDDDLVTVAAQTSARIEPAEKPKLGTYLDQLPPEEMRNFLQRVLNGERHLDIALRKRLLKFMPPSKQPTSQPGKRTLKTLLRQAAEIEAARQIEKARKAATARLKRFEAIAQQEAQLWEQVPTLIEQKKGQAYDEAVKILKDLKNLAAHEERLAEFQDRVRTIQARYSRLSALQRRIKSAALIK